MSQASKERRDIPYKIEPRQFCKEDFVPDRPEQGRLISAVHGLLDATRRAVSHKRISVDNSINNSI